MYYSQRHLLSNEGKVLRMLAPRSFSSYQRRFKEKSERLSIQIERHQDVHCDLDYLRLALYADERRINKYTICPLSLLDSVFYSEEHPIYTCPHCGGGDCAGFLRGVHVAHSAGFTLWKVFKPHPRRVYLFRHPQYREEIITGYRELQFQIREKPSLAMPYLSADKMEDEFLKVTQINRNLEADNRLF